MTAETLRAALAARIGWRFTDEKRLERALTHSSMGAARDLERLEFLGDRVLGILVAAALFERFPEMSEGELAPRLNALVRRETCAEAARAVDLGDAIVMADAEAASGGRDKDAILADACEALLGALYLDGGLEAARRFYDLFWAPNFDRLAARWRDPKTELQEWAQGGKRGTPAYKILATDGPDHAPTFLAEVSVNGYKAAKGRGASKRAAQTAAAEAFLRREGLWTDE